MVASMAALIPLAQAVMASWGALGWQVMRDARERAPRPPRHGEVTK